MRLEQKCKCGAEILVVYDVSTRGYNAHDERGEARKHIDAFRRAHKGCLPATGDYGKSQS